MADNFDSAVGAVLEIPPQALKAIEDAEKALVRLHDASKKAADQVYGDFSKRMPMGVDAFIKKLEQAQNALNGLSSKPVEFNINTNTAQQKLESLSSQTKKTGTDVSSTVQQMAGILTQIDFTNLKDSLAQIGMTFKQFESELKKVIENRDKLQMTDDTVQQLNNVIAAMREYLKLQKQSTEEKDKAARKQADNSILLEQKNILAQRLEIQKQINAEELRQQRSKDLGKVISQDEINKLNDFKQRLDALNQSYDELKKRTSELSEKGISKFNAADIKNELALNKELTASQERLNQARQQAITQLDETKLKSPGISSREEARYQAQLVGVYNQMIQIIKMKGDMEAKVAAQGGAATQAQTNYLKTLESEYNRLETSLTKVSRKYTEIDRVTASNFANAKTLQEAENMVKLDEATRKATESAKKHGLALQDTSAIEAKIQSVKQQIDQEALAFQNVGQKVRDAQAAFDALKNASPNFNIHQAEQQLESLRSKVQRLYDQLAGGELTPKKENRITKEIAQLTPQIQELENKIIAIRRAAYDLAYAEEDAKNANTNYSNSIAALLKELRSYERELKKVQEANAQINAEISKGSTTVTLAKEYKDLTKRLQEVNQAMTDFRSRGGDIKSPSYQALEQEYLNILSRRKEIEKMDIAEVNQYRQQMAQQAYQADLSAFVQNEEQKKAKALQTIKEESDARRAAYQQYITSYEGALRAADKLGSGRTSGNYADTFENRARVIKQLETAMRNLSKADADYERKIETLRQKLKELGATQEQVNRAMKGQVTPTVATAQQAVQTARATKSLKDLKEAYEQLKAVMSTMDSSSAGFKRMARDAQEMKNKIDQIKRSMGEFQSQTKRTGDLMDGLKGKIAAAFSAAAISGFIKKVVETRAQFELQRVALGAILQDTDKANKTFLQVQQMALQSPFSIMQLERATKQVAAFGFEADKLLPTMKMLADMSAGLGVEIDRFVLVMGHLKARNYLEGTMVRQFTNAGFNVLGELAKYYTELEGKMVSVAEVQTRVKKKMVEFGDVEEVLKRVTSAGGMFYDMQKKQSDSIWGQMQRITDAYDLMLNEIGKDNQNMISKALSAIREMINHWRVLAPVVKEIGYAMAAIFAAKGIQALILGFTKFGAVLVRIPSILKNIAVGIKTMNLAWSTTGLGALIALGTTAIAVFQGMRAEANALNEELAHIGEDSVKNLNNMISDYIRLANVVSDANKTYGEQEDALKDIKRIYSELLPDYMKEREYIQGLNGDYRQVIDTLSEYYQAKEYQQKYETVMASKQAKDVISDMEDALLKANKEGGLGLLFPDAQVKAWSEKISQELLTGKIANSADKLEQRLKEIFPTSKDLPDFSKVIRDNTKVQESVMGIALATSQAENANEYLYASYKKIADDRGVEQALENIASREERLREEIQKNQEAIEKTTHKQYQGYITSGEAERRIKSYTASIESATAELEYLTQARSKVIAQQFNEIIDEETKKLTDEVKLWWNNKIAMEDAVKQGKNVGKTWDEMVKKDEDLRKSLKELEDEFELVENDLGEKLPWSMLESAETTYELETAIDKISKDAFPHVAKVAKDKMKDVLEAFLKAKGGVLSFLKSIYDVLPDTLKGLVPDVGALVEANEAELAALRDSMGDTKEKAEEAGKSLKQIYSEVALKNAKKYEATMQRTNTIIGDGTKTRAEMAKEFHQEAESLKADLKSFDEATDQTAWLESERKSLAEIAQMRKDAEAYAATAQDLGYTDNKKKGKGKDEILDLWKNRLKAVEDFYKRYEELRKHYDTTESLKRDREAFAALFKTLGLNMEQVISAGMDKQGLANNLKRMTEEVAKVRPQLVDEFQKAFADTQIQVDFKIKEDSEEELKRKLEEMFNTYELGKEFTGLGLPVELTMMLGKEPIKSPEDLRDLLQKGLEAEGGDKAPLEIAKMYKDAMDKVNDIIFKNQKEQIKNYNKYLIESMGERVQIELRAMQDINKIREDANLDAFSKEQAIMQRRKQLTEDLAKFDFDKLKASDIYINTFKDLENASKQSLQYVIDKLEELKSVNENLSVSQVRALTNEIKKAQEALAEQTALPDFGKNLKDAVNYARKRKQLILDQIEFQKQLDDKKEQLDQEQKVLYELVKQRDMLEQGSEEWEKANEEVLKQQMLVSFLENEVKRLGGEVEGVNEKISQGELAWEGVKSAIGKVHSNIKQVKDAMDSVFDGLDSMGLVNDAFRDTYESISEIIGGLDTIMSGLESIDITKPFSIITGSIRAIGGIFQTIGAVFGIGDKKKEREIKRLQKSVEELDKAYQKLEKSIESAFTFDQYNAGYKQAQKNLEEQKRAYEDMIRLEEAKKKTDDEKIQEYKDKIEEIAEAQEELRKQRIEAMGSTTDYFSEAESFVSAWLDAYKEVGNGIDALSDSWEEFIENLFVKQAAAQLVSEKLSNVIKTINDAIENEKTDFGLKEAVKQAREEWGGYIRDIEPMLEELFGSYGLKKGKGEYVLSDLQKGIQNITEPQAAAIEAYLNSMRFAVFRHTEQLDILITTIQAQYGAGESPVLQEVRLIRSVVESINTQLSRVIVNKNSNTNYVLKVG